MKFSQIVQDVAERDHNFSLYDENFVFLRQTQISQVSLEPFTGNCGCARRLIRVEQGMCLHRKVLHDHLRLCLFRGAFTINFTAETTAREFRHVCFKYNGAHRSVNSNFRRAAKTIFLQ